MKKVFFYSAIMSSAILFSLAVSAQSAPTAVPGKALEPVVPKTSKPIESTSDAEKYKPVAPVFNDLAPTTAKTIKEDKNQQQTKPVASKEPDTSLPPGKKVELKEIPPVIAAAPVLQMTPIVIPVQQNVKKVAPEQQKPNQ